MSRKFNGTSDAAQIALNLSAFSLISISFWLWWDAFANNDKLAMEFTANFNLNRGFLIDPNSGAPAAGAVQIGFDQTNTLAWVDSFTRPSAAAWHHWMLVMNRATPANFAWIDGAVQTLTAVQHNAATYANFPNSTLNIMSRNKASLFGAGRMAELAIWGGVALTTANAKALAAGAAPPHFVVPDNLILYTPLMGADSPEPDYSGKKQSATLTGTSWAAHPGVMPGLNRINRSFQPMPV